MQDEQYSILVVDDNEVNRELLARRLQRENYAVAVAENGAKALDILGGRPFDVVLLDIMMPVMDGHEVLKRMKSSEALRHIPVIMVTALTDQETAAQFIEEGAEDYLHKPFSPLLLKARVTASLAKKRLHDQEERYRRLVEQQNSQLEERVCQQVHEISSAQLGMIFAMSKLAESKDPETGAHLERMREYCKILAQQLRTLPKYRSIIDEQFIDNIYAASPLHDIGKVGIPDDILLKPGPLDDAEREIMKVHTSIGAQTLRAVDREHPGNVFIHIGIQIAEGHHEKWDGSGYPNGLAGETIPLPARILALGDVYDALTSVRCYKKAFSHDKAREIIVQGNGEHFDPDVVAAFLASDGEFTKIRARFRDA